MQQLNYHHLYYFYVTAREGSIMRAAELLHLTPQTVSGQIATFEDYLGKKLFDRKGKRLILNQQGQFVYSYAEDIFSLGSELLQNLKQKDSGHHLHFTIGVTDIIPKVLAFDLFRTCLDHDDNLKLVCKEGDLHSLMADLALNKLDLIFSDQPLPPGGNVKAYNHFVGETGLAFFANPSNATALRADFPKSLHQTPFLLPGEKSTQRVELTAWFDRLGIVPDVVAEFEDSALMKLFAQSGYGVFGAPATIAQHVTQQYDLEVIGTTQDITEDFYLISPERKLKHPAALHLFEFANKMINPEPA